MIYKIVSFTHSLTTTPQSMPPEDTWITTLNTLPTIKEKNPFQFYKEIAVMLTTILEQLQRSPSLGFSFLSPDFKEKFNQISPIQLEERLPKTKGTFTTIGDYQLSNAKAAPLGSGAFGKVKRAKDKMGNICAVKKVYTSDIKSEKIIYLNDLIRLLREADIGQNLPKSPQGLLPIDKASVALNKEGTATVYFFMPLIAGDTVVSANVQSWPIAKKLEQGLNLGCALESLHSNGMIHGDLNFNNIKFEENNVTIFDWGLAAYNNEQSIKKDIDGGSLGVMSPEVTRLIVSNYKLPWVVQKLTAPRAEDLRDEKNDVWSFGVILFQLVVGAHPFSTKSELNNIGLSAYLDYRRMNKGSFHSKASKLLKQYPPEVRRFFKAIFVPKDRRPTMADCCIQLKNLINQGSEIKREKRSFISRIFSRNHRVGAVS